MPIQRIGSRAYMRSTYDRFGGNETADASHFLFANEEDFNVTLDVKGRPKLEGIEVTDEEIARIAERQGMAARLMRHSLVAEYDIVKVFVNLNYALASIFMDLRRDTKAEKL